MPTSRRPNRTRRRRLARSAEAKARTAESADAKTNAGGGGVAVEFRGLHRIIRPTRAFVLLAVAAAESRVLVYWGMLALTASALAPLCHLRHGPRPDRRPFSRYESREDQRRRFVEGMAREPSP